MEVLDTTQGKALQSYLQQHPGGVFSKKELSGMLASAKKALHLPRDISTESLVGSLEEAGALRKAVLTSPLYEPFTRYILAGASPYQLALSLRPGSYISHGSAMFLHALTQQLPRTIYVNKEQSVKPASTGVLSQESINRAFSGAGRESNYVFEFEDWRVVLLNGKNSGSLEVGQLAAPDGLNVPATKLERTLIDITVRPAYSGGVYEVLEAYRSAKSRVSVNVLIATLRKLGHVYPYHQAIGLYMQRAGYEESRLTRLKELGMPFDFHLTYGLKEGDYIPEWKIFVPKGF